MFAPRYPLAHALIKACSPCLLLGCLSLVSSLVLVVSSTAQVPTTVKVAFVGDQGVNNNAKAVLQLIKDEGAEMVLVQGDLGYSSESNPQSAIDWENQINDILGPDFPLFAAIGNHDQGNWPLYQQMLYERLSRIDGATCIGDLGVKSACHYKGLFFILSGAGTKGSDHATYIKDELALDHSTWRICSWHKNQREMQVGGKGSSVGWGPYEECRQGGALIATAHEHSYQRTKTLINTETQTVDPAWPDPDNLRVTPGSTFVFVSGLGGASVRDQERCFPTTFPYGCNGEWANIYTSDQGATYGALFIDFGVDGNPSKARGYMKNIAGEIIDTFEVLSVATPVVTPDTTTPANPTGLRIL